MHRDDRLFAIIGGTVVAATAAVILTVASGITGSIDRLPAPGRSATPARTGAPPTPGAPAAGVLPASTARTPPSVDLAVRALLSGLSAHPEWAAWLATDEILARFVAAVEAVADGYSPTDQLGFTVANGPFLVREHEGDLVIAAGTFRRYTLAVDVLSSIDVGRAAAILRELEPAIEAVRSDAAWSRGSFDDRLRQAVDHLLEVEIPSAPIRVERRATRYVFADDRHEALSDAQRQLLRMGRGNALRVQAKLTELRRELGWPEPPPPPEPDLRFAVLDEVADEVAAPESVASAPVLATEPFEPRTMPDAP
ncbi:MAG: DUF3014 domain-containing protein [Thermoanaerobaculales bacterium]|nr:DUF3014 domain-containing protein [Thermoanaerobaculales bacterium]